jgi:hypothetical protein
VEWLTKSAKAGLPKAMFDLGVNLDKGEGVPAPDYPAAAGWYRRAADAGDEMAARNLSCSYMVGKGRGGVLSKNTQPISVESTDRVRAFL